MKNWLIWFISALIISAGALVYFYLSQHDRTESYQGTELSGDAPNFQLTDQNSASQVAFIGVNVNVEANKVSDVAEITKTWHLEEIPSWHFLTGNREDLTVVWKDYGVAVFPSADGKEIMHTPGVFLIDPLGQKRWYISTPYSTDLTLPLSELLLKHIREILQS